ncbi:MAG TPA: hypothetical protein VMC79_16825, partial [Rectinemataceae bacterium]|nr:hypothetical protein [Rectinemataceae bacterium]
MGVRILHSSKALGTATIPDSFTHSLYRLAPYTGCEHGCLYCDGRAERYFVEGQFERDIVIREDIPELLRAELPRLRESGIIGIGSGVTDPYQPTEGRVALVRRCAEQLARYPHGDDRQVPSLELYENHASPASPRLCAMVMTKSKLALRDLELWGRLNRVTGFMLLVSLTSLQED